MIALQGGDCMEEITTRDVMELIKEHNTSKYKKMLDYYKGNHHGIRDRKSADANKPNNRIVNNYSGYIVDVNLGYFLGKPIVYTSSNDQFVEKLSDIFKYNDEQDENIQLAKEAGIKGTAFELLYFDEEANIRFGVVNPESLILVYDNSINPNPLYAVRYWYENDGKILKAELYTADKIVYYESVGKTTLTEIEAISHPFQDIPVIEFPNNDERQGDFEKVLTLIDAYDFSQSDTANDFEYFADAYLKIKNMGGTDEETINSMKQNRAILLQDGGDADWLVKNQDYSGMEAFKNRIVADIHKLSKTANLTDEAFAGNVSGIALQYKLWGMEQNTAQKERKFKKAIQRRIELICNYLSTIGVKYDWRDVDISFNRNVPENSDEIADMIGKLRGIVSDGTLISRLPFIDDPVVELQKIQEQNDATIDLSRYMEEDTNEEE